MHFAGRRLLLICTPDTTTAMFLHRGFSSSQPHPACGGSPGERVVRRAELAATPCTSCSDSHPCEGKRILPRLHGPCAQQGSSPSRPANSTPANLLTRSGRVPEPQCNTLIALSIKQPGKQYPSATSSAAQQKAFGSLKFCGPPNTTSPKDTRTTCFEIHKCKRGASTGRCPANKNLKRFLRPTAVRRGLTVLK